TWRVSATHTRRFPKQFMMPRCRWTSGRSTRSIDQDRSCLPGRMGKGRTVSRTFALFPFRTQRRTGRNMKSICVYCGSNSGSKPAYTERAAALGDRIAKEGLRLVYGGGNVGLMGVVANAVLEAGGQV